MSKLTGFLLSATFLCLGMLLGILLAPVKNGFSIGNNSGNTYCRDKDDDNEYEDEWAF